MDAQHDVEHAVRQNGTTLTSTAGVFHFQPTSFAGCRADTAGALSVPNLCIDDGSLDRDLRFDGAYDRSIISDRNRFNGFAFVNHDLDNGVRLYAEFGYYYAETQSTNEPRNGIAATEISVPANYYYNPFGPITFSDGSINPNRLPGLTNVPAEGLPVFTDGGRYRFVDVGFRDIEVINTQWRALGGARGEFANGWDWTARCSITGPTRKTRRTTRSRGPCSSRRSSTKRRMSTISSMAAIRTIRRSAMRPPTPVT